ncbi:MAG: Brp/Blh family beta-carotene 15,15'-dioxygenase [Opitutales bacterium]
MAAALAGLALQSLLNPGADARILLLTVFVVLLGLPHGALDPLVARRARVWTGLPGLIGFLALYVLLAGATLLLWLWLPGVALVLFLAYAAWHFGGDWDDALPPPRRLLPGTLIVTGPMLWWGAEVESYFATLAGPAAAAGLRQILPTVALVALVGTLVLALRQWRSRRDVAIELGVLALACALLPPLLFFVVYFCGLHSPRHLGEAVRGERPSHVWAVGVAILLVTLGGAFSLWQLAPPGHWEEGLLRTVFIGLAALTVPHMLLVDAAENRGWRERLKGAREVPQGGAARVHRA